MSVLYYKAKDIILLVIIVVFAYFMVSNGLALKRFQKERKSSIDKLQEKNDSIIKSKQNQIMLILQDNQRKQKQIIQHQQKIDSLVSLKSRVKIKYVNILKEVDKYNSDKVFGYWDSHFNKQ